MWVLDHFIISNVQTSTGNAKILTAVMMFSNLVVLVIFSLIGLLVCQQFVLYYYDLSSTSKYFVWFYIFFRVQISFLLFGIVLDKCNSKFNGLIEFNFVHIVSDRLRKRDEVYFRFSIFN